VSRETTGWSSISIFSISELWGLKVELCVERM
jgi:hypothetical protein